MNKYLALTALGLILLAVALLLSHQSGVIEEFKFEGQAGNSTNATAPAKGFSSIVRQVPPPDSEEAKRLTLGETVRPADTAGPTPEESLPGSDSADVQAQTAPPEKAGEETQETPQTLALTAAENQPEVRAEVPAPEQAEPQAPALLEKPKPKPMAEVRDSDPNKGQEKALEVAKGKTFTAEAEAVPVAVESPDTPIAGAANRVETIVLENSGNLVTMTIKARSEIATFKSFTLANPTRFVLDISGKWEKGPQVETPANELIRNVRHGLHPDSFRVVADLQAGIDISPSVTQPDPRTLLVRFKR